MMLWIIYAWNSTVNTEWYSAPQFTISHARHFAFNFITNSKWTTHPVSFKQVPPWVTQELGFDNYIPVFIINLFGLEAEEWNLKRIHLHRDMHSPWKHQGLLIDATPKESFYPYGPTLNDIFAYITKTTAILCECMQNTLRRSTLTSESDHWGIVYL